MYHTVSENASTILQKIKKISKICDFTIDKLRSGCYDVAVSEKFEDRKEEKGMNKLKAKVVENGMSMDELSRAVGISRDTLYRRLSSGAGSFRVAEAKKISEVLHLTSEERDIIFFS